MEGYVRPTAELVQRAELQQEQALLAILVVAVVVWAWVWVA